MLHTCGNNEVITAGPAFPPFSDCHSLIYILLHLESPGLNAPSGKMVKIPKFNPFPHHELPLFCISVYRFSGFHSSPNHMPFISQTPSSPPSCPLSRKHPVVNLCIPKDHSAPVPHFRKYFIPFFFDSLAIYPYT